MNSTSLSSESRALTARGTMQPWQFFLTASFLAAAAAVWLSPPSSPVALLFLSLGIAAAGACASALYALLTAVAGRSGAETGVSGSVRETLEREKLLTLRAIKDLEFDRAMGKVSAADAAPLEVRLRARAIDIMRQLDDRESLRARIEADFAGRRAQDSGLRADDSGLRTQGSTLRTGEAVPLQCGACATTNDPDAKFCKSCGAKL